MSWQDDRNSRKLHSAPYPGGREPRFDVPPRSQRGAAHERDARSEINEEVARDRESASREETLHDGQGPDRRAEEPVRPAEPSAPLDDGETGALSAALDKAQAEIAELKDKALRATAEVENFRRRAEKEREDVAKYAISGFAREMLPVADNLRRALDSQPSLSGEAAAAVKNFVTGVELTERELIAAFERFGLTRIDPMGQPFDHNLHQAMFEVEDVNQAAGTVVQVMQPGYVLKERLLRPALVGVSKGGPAREAGNDDNK